MTVPTPTPAPEPTPSDISDLAPPQGADEAEWEALVALYLATDGPNWHNSENWLSDESLSKWYGVSTHRGNVTELSLRRNGLAGEIPPELGKLTKLRRLDLAYNRLTGPVPPELGNLKSSLWYAISLEGHSLTGCMPYVFRHDYPVAGPGVLGLPFCIPTTLSDFVWQEGDAGVVRALESLKREHPRHSAACAGIPMGPGWWAERL